MEKISDVQNIRLNIGQAFSQKIDLRQGVYNKSATKQSEDSKYVAFFVDAYQNPAGHSFHFA
ncbi:MAG: hypothetical protein ABW003_13660 [Microvirga sp.]